jgi:hypothetical protein
MLTQSGPVATLSFVSLRIFRNSFLQSVLFSSVLCLLLYFRIPQELNVTVEPIGQPTYFNYNINFRFWVYYLICLFPILVSLFWWGIRKFMGEEKAIQSLRTFSSVSPMEFLEDFFGGPLLRTTFIGFVLGIGLSFRYWWNGEAFSRMLCVAAAYTAISFLVAKCVSKRVSETVAVINSLAIPLTLLSLLEASSSTVVRIATTGELVAYPWFSPKLCWPLILIAESIALVSLFRAHSRKETYLKTEARLFWTIAVPVLIWLLNGYTDGPMRDVDYIHHAEATLAAETILKGGFPWRDLMTTAGIFHGLVRGLVGFTLFEHSSWGVEAAQHLIFEPAHSVLLYFFLLQLIGMNRPFLLLLFFVFPWTFPKLFGHSFVRVCLYPSVLGLCLLTLRSQKVLFCAAAAAAVVTLGIVTPEASFLLPAFFVTLFFSELASFQKGKPIKSSFRLSLVFFVSACATFLLFLAFLYANHALKNFFDYYVGYTRDPRFIRGFAFSVPSLWFLAAALAPPVLYIFWVLFLLFKGTHGRKIRSEEWLMGTISIYGILHYQKYLNQPDNHVYEPYIMVFPCVAWMLAQIYTYFESHLVLSFKGKIIRPLAFLLAIISVTLTWPNRLAWGMSFPHKFTNVVPPKTEFYRAGWVQLPESTYTVLKDLQYFFSSYSNDSEKVWDLSASPGLFYHLLQRPFPSPIFMSLEAHHIRSATRILEDIERERPEWVVFHSEKSPWTYLFGVSAGRRNYVLKQYALQKYRPFLVLDGYLIMLRADLNIPLKRETLDYYSERASTQDLYLHTGTCDWGYSPNFLKTPQPSGKRVPLSFDSPKVPGPGSSITQVALPKDLSLRDFPYIEIEFATKTDSNISIHDQFPGEDWMNHPFVSFSTLSRRAPLYRIPVGSCGQWFAFRGEKLFLAHSPETQISKIVLSQ